MTMAVSSKELANEIEIATTLLARDYKGYGGYQLGNGVIEK